MKNKVIPFKIVHIKLFFMIFMAGFILGIFFTNFFGKNYISGTGVLSDYFLRKFKYIDINSGELLFKVLKMRGKTFFLLWILGSTVFGAAAVCGYLCWMGFSIGILLTVAAMKFGVKGIFICLGGILPQYFIYIPLLLLFTERVLAMSVSPIGSREMLKSGSKGRAALWKDYILLLVVSLCILAIGCLIESYVNPYLLQFILKKLD